MSPRWPILDFLRRGRTLRYGHHRSQRADLHLPSGAGSHPVMVLVHGGAWRSRYGRIVMRPLGADLLRRGWAVWNIEYRRLGGGGGWPATFLDVASAIDMLPTIDAPLDMARVSILGHSAGGHLALWAAGRSRLPPGAPGHRGAGEERVRLRRAIAQAGVCDLARAYRRRGDAVWALMGGAPEELPERYAVGDPIRLVPTPMPVLLVHGRADMTVGVALSRSYARAARASGGEVELVEIEGRAGAHGAHLDPRGRAWAEVATRLEPARAGSEAAVAAGQVEGAPS